MTDPNERLMTDLRRVLDAVDGDRPESTEAAKAALAWRNIDVELAALTFDSEIDEPEVAVRSGATDVRRLSFTAAAVTIEVETDSTDGLIGQVIPPAPAVVRMLTADGAAAVETESDDMGMFRIANLPAAPICLECSAADGSWSVRTSWIIA